MGGVLGLMGTVLDRITVDLTVMGGRPCVRGTRVTVGTVVVLLAVGHDVARVLELYPYLAEADVRQCLAYASWRSGEHEPSLARR
jgi:uncharacterized protein (DUF433 family)